VSLPGPCLGARLESVISRVEENTILVPWDAGL
jgi:hypothetical protein